MLDSSKANSKATLIQGDAYIGDFAAVGEAQSRIEKYRQNDKHIARLPMTSGRRGASALDFFVTNTDIEREKAEGCIKT
jgi:hypothetical protein